MGGIRPSARGNLNPVLSGDHAYLPVSVPYVSEGIDLRHGGRLVIG